MRKKEIEEESEEQGECELWENFKGRGRSGRSGREEGERKERVCEKR